MNKAMKRKLSKILISSLLFALGIAINFNNIVINNFLFIIAYLIIGYDILRKAFLNIKSGQIFDENFLMSIATLGAISIQEFAEAVAVMLFYEVGELFQDYAVDKSKKSIAKAMDIRPDFANLKVGDKIETIAPDKIEINDIIIIKAGEKVPLDGVVVAGETMLDTSALTGESVPNKIKEGDAIISGCINLNSMITVKVSKKYEDSTVNKILDLVENASSKKSNQERFISRFAKIYTPVVVIIAILVAILPPLIMPNQIFYDWLYKALTFLVIACPCALVVSIPLSFFGGLGGASRRGILIKGSNYLEALARVNTMIFDKTGTLTEGVFEVQSINPINISNEELLKYAAYAEKYSNHPIANSILRKYNLEIETNKISDVEEISGHGVSINYNGKNILAGNHKLMEKYNIKYISEESYGTVVYIALDKKYIGNIVISDKIKEDSKSTIKRLRKKENIKTVMLTGDNKKVADKVGNILGIDEIHSQLLPQDKFSILEEKISNSQENDRIAFVGDGINDAPALALADVGIAMGGLGSDAAIEASDIVLMNDKISNIPVAIEISRKTLSIAYQNTYFSIGAKVLVLLLSLLGITNMWMAIFADVGVTIIAILNSFRGLNTKNI